MRKHFMFLNIGHFLDHMFILIYPTVVLALQDEWSFAYDDLLIYGSLGVFAFGAASIPMGWLGDRWSRHGMMSVFFIGIGLSAIGAGFATTPLQIGMGMLAIGIFAAIYHPVGIAMVFSGAENAGRDLAVNGVWGNLGLAAAAVSAATITELIGWKFAFFIPGVISVVIGIVYALTYGRQGDPVIAKRKSAAVALTNQRLMARIFFAMAMAATLGGLVFHATSTALPKIIEQGATGVVGRLSEIGLFAMLIFAVASVAQLIIGSLIEKYEARWILACVTATQALFLFLAPAGSDYVLMILLFGMMFAVFGQIPVNDWLVGHYSANEWRARFYALKYTLGLTVAALAYWLVATLHARFGDFDMLYMLLGGLMTLVAISSMLLPDHKTEAAAAAPQPAE
tara:strand:+ start:1265 stop:2455 length:1191 start_codon:yes stop_codon:yes gene_type:complete